MTPAHKFPSHKVLIASVLVFLFIPFSNAFAQCANPSGQTGEIVYNTTEDLFQGCLTGGWQALHSDTGGGGPSGCPNIGDTCPDGSVYAGLSPDGNVPMYTTPADAGGIPWNNGNSTGYVNLYTPITESFVGGEASTAAFIGVDSDSVTPGVQPFQAPEYCYNLTAHGHSDWYVPARDEFFVLRDNQGAIGGFTGTNYWSSSEVCCNAVRYYDLSGGGRFRKQAFCKLRPLCAKRGQCRVHQPFWANRRNHL